MTPSTLPKGMTDPLRTSDVRESHRRSRVREDLVLAVAELGVAHLALLADRAGVSPRMARLALDGRRPFFRPELSPLRLGLIVELPSGSRRVFEITPEGEREARRILRERVAAARRVLRGQARQQGATRARRGRFRF